MLKSRFHTIFFVLLLTMPWLASTNTANAAAPEATTSAVRVLFASAATPIWKHSTCYGQYGQQGAPTLGDLLAVERASMYAGSNCIGGRCEGPRCEVVVSHAAGEDVSNTQIRFNMKHGRIVPATLACLMTP